MNSWRSVFGSYSNSGVYCIEKSPQSRTLKNAANTNGLEFTLIDMKNVSGKESFLNETAKALHFPSYFGMNWDAMNDGLTDMSWKPASGYVIVFVHFQTIYRSMATEVQIIKNMFDSCAQYWREKKVPFYIILSG